MTKTVELKPFDRKVADDVYSCLFCHIETETEDGLMEIPSASYQLVVSALESMLWEARDMEEKTALRKAVGLVESYRDRQKMREWHRRGN